MRVHCKKYLIYYFRWVWYCKKKKWVFLIIIFKYVETCIFVWYKQLNANV